MSRVAAHAHFAFATIAIVLGGAGAAQASFVTTSPDPFPPGSGYVQANGCVTSGPLAGLCSSNVMGTILSASSTFSGGNEFVGLNELVVGDLSDGSAPVGHFSVTGTLNLTLLGRTDPLETGSFHATVTGEDYMGSIAGIPLAITLDSSQTSSADITITRLSEQPPLFRIDSFFDISSEISIAGGSPIPVGGFPITGVATPEPATLALMGLSLAALAGLGWRRAG
jgi:hypothetical protein